MRTPESAPLLSPALKDESHVVRMAAAKALATIGGDEACRMALALLEDKHPQVRLSAVTSLGEIGLADALDQLVDVIFGEDDEEIRAWAAWSLGEIGDSRAVEHLQEACIKCPPAVREKALDSLEQVFGIGTGNRKDEA
jgi:HEAT repeat protein